MSPVSRWLHLLIESIFSIITLAADAGRFLRLRLRSPAALVAEVLFLRKQLALYEKRQVKPRRATNATRMTMVWLSHFFDWRPALRIVKPETFTGWHRQCFRLFWRWKSKPGTPRFAQELAGVDPPHGSGKSPLGPGAHCQRVVARNWASGIASNRAQVHAEPLRREPRQALSIAALVHVYP